MSLPTYYDLCPEGTATSQDTAPYTFAQSDVWIPYSGDCNDGDTNTWVELGHSTHIFCGTHHDTGCADITSCCGGYPGWGEANGDEYAWVYVTGLPSVLCVAGYDNYGGDDDRLNASLPEYCPNFNYSISTSSTQKASGGGSSAQMLAIIAACASFATFCALWFMWRRWKYMQALASVPKAKSLPAEEADARGFENAGVLVSDEGPIAHALSGHTSLDRKSTNFGSTSASDESAIDKVEAAQSSMSCFEGTCLGESCLDENIASMPPLCGGVVDIASMPTLCGGVVEIPLDARAGELGVELTHHSGVSANHAQVHEPTVATDGATPGPSSGSTHTKHATALAL